MEKNWRERERERGAVGFGEVTVGFGRRNVEEELEREREARWVCFRVSMRESEMEMMKRGAVRRWVWTLGRKRE